MATKTGIDLKKTPEGWTAPCGCRFHIFDGPPRIEEYRSGETTLVGKLEPHWHPCKSHAPQGEPEWVKL